MSNVNGFLFNSWYTVCFLFLLRWFTWARSTFQRILYIRVVCLGENVMMMAIKDDEHWYVNVCCVCKYACVRCACLLLSKFVFIRLLLRQEEHLLFIIMEFRQIYCEMSTSAPSLASFGIPFVRLKNQNLSVFLVYIRVCFCVRVFFFVSIFTALSTLNSTHADVKLSETYSVARFTFNTRKCQ